MSTSRQSIADEELHQSNWRRRPGAILRYVARKLAFSHPHLRALVERGSLSSDDAQSHWDSVMSQSNYSTYLGRTIHVDSCNAMTALLIKYHAVSYPSVLDVGCSGGTLALALPPFRHYLGTDVSRHAIDSGRTDPDLKAPAIELQAVDMRLFETRQTWDAIVFNEVLYYLTSCEAIEQVERYIRFLAPDGIVCVSMKHDPKSVAIFALLQKKYHWIDGMLWQRKALTPDYSVRIDRERPAFLLGVFKPN